MLVPIPTFQWQPQPGVTRNGKNVICPSHCRTTDTSSSSSLWTPLSHRLTPPIITEVAQPTFHFLSASLSCSLSANSCVYASMAAPSGVFSWSAPKMTTGRWADSRRFRTSCVEEPVAKSLTTDAESPTCCEVTEKLYWLTDLFLFISSDGKISIIVWENILCRWFSLLIRPLASAIA